MSIKLDLELWEREEPSCACLRVVREQLRAEVSSEKSANKETVKCYSEDRVTYAPAETVKSFLIKKPYINK